MIPQSHHEGTRSCPVKLAAPLPLNANIGCLKAALDPKPSANQLFYWALVKCHAHGIGGVSDSSTMESLDADP